MIEKTLSQIDVSGLTTHEQMEVNETLKEIAALKGLSEQETLTTPDKIAFRSNILHLQDTYKLINTSP